MRAPANYRSKLPVICVGNFTAGGTGKTPFVRMLVHILSEMGHAPVVLSRGHGSKLTGPHRVDPQLDRASDVGDEPLLLSGSVPVVIARDRAAGAAAIEQGSAGIERASVIVMDDGMQNPALKKTLTIALVDAARGFGNGRCIPAGPLRAPLRAQLPRVDAVVLNRGNGGQGGPGLANVFQSAGKPVLSARVLPDSDAAWIRAERVVAFTGIGVPDRFFSSLAAAGAEICGTVRFADHQVFTDADAKRILALAREKSALPVTTEKDAVRLRGASGALAELAQASRALPVTMRLDDGSLDLLKTMIAERVPVRA